MPEILVAYIIALIDMPNCSLLHLHFNMLEIIIPQKCSTAAIFYNEKETNIFRICWRISHTESHALNKAPSSTIMVGEEGQAKPVLSRGGSHTA